MPSPDLKTLARELKEHLLDNQGEIVYWGDRLSLRATGGSEAIWSSDKSLHQTSSATADCFTSFAMTKTERLQILRDQTIGDCHRCPLGNTRLKLVFGVGNPESAVMFIGEGPGFDEDRRGEPFVGKAGQLLDRILASIGLDRTSVYIANIVKCHPMVDPRTPDKRGNDRPPTPEEMAECLPFLKEQIQIISPRFIVTLGSTATKALLGRREGITALRGKFFDFTVGDGKTVRLLPTFHPAALLRDETLKKSVWEDMKMLRSALAVIARDHPVPIAK